MGKTEKKLEWISNICPKKFHLRFGLGFSRGINDK